MSHPLFTICPNVQRLAACGLTLALFAAPVSAATIFFDGFGDADRNNDGTLEGTVDANNEVGPAWWLARGSSGLTLTIEDDSAGIGSLNAIRMNTTTSRTRMLGAAIVPVTSTGLSGAQSLANVGDKLTLSFDLRSNEVEDSDKSFRFGFSNDGGTPQGYTDAGVYYPGDNGTNDQTDDNTGYYAALSWGTPTGTTAEIRGDVVDAVLGHETFMGGDDSIDFGANTTAAAGSINDLLKHSVVFSIERVADDAVTGDPADLLLTLIVDGNTLISRKLSEGGADPHVTDFQYVYIGTNNGRLDYLWDNVLVDFSSVPEPASLALLAAGGLLMLRRRGVA